MTGSRDRSFHHFENIWGDQIKTPQYLDTSTVSVQQLPMLNELLELHLGQLHQAVDLILGPVEVFQTKSIDGDHLDTTLVANLQNPGQSLEAEVMAFYCLDLVTSGISSVAVHFESDMAWDRSLAQ